MFDLEYFAIGLLVGLPLVFGGLVIGGPLGAIGVFIVLAVIADKVI